MLQAKSSLSRLVAEVESGEETEIIIARNGRPVARVVRYEEAPAQRRLGVAKGQVEIPDDIGASNEEIMALFGQ